MLEGLKEKAGPLPVWAWGGLGAVAVAGFLYLGRSTKNDRQPASAVNDTGMLGVAGGPSSTAQADLEELLQRLRNGSNDDTHPPGYQPTGVSLGPILSNMKIELDSITADNQAIIERYYAAVAEQSAQPGWDATKAENLWQQYDSMLQNRLNIQTHQIGDNASIWSNLVNAGDGLLLSSNVQAAISEIRRQQAVWLKGHGYASGPYAPPVKLQNMYVPFTTAQTVAVT